MGPNDQIYQTGKPFDSDKPLLIYGYELYNNTELKKCYPELVIVLLSVPELIKKRLWVHPTLIYKNQRGLAAVADARDKIITYLLDETGTIMSTFTKKTKSVVVRMMYYRDCDEIHTYRYKHGVTKSQ